MQNTTIKTDTDFKLDIEEHTYSDGEKVTYICLKGVGHKIGFLFLKEDGGVSFELTETNDKPIFKENTRDIDNDTIVHETTLRTNKVKVGITTLQTKKNKK
jgi:hypothetical protein